MSTAAVNGTDAAKASAAGNMAASKPQMKSNAHGKVLDGARKQAASPVDGQNRKQASQAPKAWQGPNPITRQANPSSLPNGTEKPLPKLPAQAQQKVNGESHADKHAHDRLLYILANFTGMDATLTLKNGEQFCGIFSGASVDSPAKSQYILKMVKQTKLPSHQQSNGVIEMPDEYTGEGEDHVMAFDIQDTIDLAVDAVTATATATQPTQNGAAPIPSIESTHIDSQAGGSIGSSFRTDTEISNREARMPRERELQRWEPELDQSLGDMSLEAGGATGWDQFAANERKYGVQSNYDEEIYTTSIDRSHPEYKRREAEAARLAREIESSAPASVHMAEERRKNTDQDDGLDEEEKYSGVRREAPALPKGGAGSYVPPSRRPITSQPTVPGAPFDPAIISTARPTPPPAAQTVAAPQISIEPAKTPEPTAPTEQKTPAVADGASKEASSASSATQAPKKAESTTEDHVRGTADAFKQFANNEKLRIRQAQEQKRINVRHEKNVRLNDLKKFSENFKLKSRVPDDLVPILAKDRDKQMEIQKKAEETAREEEIRAKEKEKASPAPSSSALVTASAVDQRSMPFTQQHSRAVSRNHRVPLAMPGGQSPRAPLSQRQQAVFRGVQPLPADLRIPAGPALPAPVSGGPLSPTSATRLNVNAFEFRPAASTFTPSGTSPSPQRTAEGMKVDAAPVGEAAFFDKETDASKRKSEGELDRSFNALKRLGDADRPKDLKKAFTSNGGIPQPYRTAPIWTVPDERLNASYLDTFPKAQAPSQGPSPLHTPNPNGVPMPHAHQLPPHLQAPQISTPNQAQRFYQHPQHAPTQSFDPMMRFGANGSVQSSPRYAPAQTAFNGQMPQMQQMPQFAGQPMQGYGMSPSMQYRSMQMPPAGPMMMMPGHPHAQMTSMRQGYPPNPQFAGGMPQMGGQMLVQPHPGGYMNGPMPPQPYSPMPPHAQPHPQQMQQHHGNQAGYSGSPRPHLMQHQGSHQGFPPPMHMAPPYGGGPGTPGQAHAGYHMQHRQLSHGGYAQMTPRQQAAVPQHMPSPGMSGVGGVQGDEGK